MYKAMEGPFWMVTVIHVYEDQLIYSWLFDHGTRSTLMAKSECINTFLDCFRLV